MSGIMYHDHGGGTTPTYRAFTVRLDTSRTIFGKIRLDNDYLFPSMEDSRDICAYIMGTEFSSDINCPRFTFEANGRPHADSNIAVLQSTTGTSSDVPRTKGTYIGVTKRYTSKVACSAYSQYDTALHRNAGVTGITTDTDIVNQYYNDLAHASVFTFDTANNNPPCYALLVATRNINITGVGLRTSQYSYATTLQWGVDFQQQTANSGMSGYSFYCKSIDQLEGPPPTLCHIYRIPRTQIVIDGNQYDLNFVYYDMPYLAASQYSTRYRTFESPYIRVERDDTTEMGRCYILDEAVTIHRPYVT